MPRREASPDRYRCGGRRPPKPRLAAHRRMPRRPAAQGRRRPDQGRRPDPTRSTTRDRRRRAVTGSRLPVLIRVISGGQCQADRSAVSLPMSAATGTGRNQPRMIGPSSATVIHTQPDRAHPGNDPQPADPSTFRSLASTRPGGRRQHRSHDPPAVTREGTRPVHDRQHPGGLVDMRAGFHDNPARNRPRGRAIPPGVAAGPSKLPMTSPVGRPNNCDGAVLDCNPAADTEGRVILPDRSPEHPKQHRTPRRAGRLLKPHSGCR
jgi:hypothetical protein